MQHGFFEWLDKKDAERFWLAAQKLEPMNDDFPRQLSGLYERLCRDTGSKRYGQKAVDWIVSALDLHEVSPRQSYLAVYVEMITCQLGEVLLSFKFTGLAIKLGNRMIQAEWWPTEIDRRDDIACIGRSRRRAPHHGYALIGRAYILQDCIELALGQLENMTDFPIPKEPDFILANELLRRGEGSIVRKYLELCLARFEKTLEDLENPKNDSPTQTKMRLSGFDTHLEVERRRARSQVEMTRLWLSTKQLPKRLFKKSTLP